VLRFLLRRLLWMVPTLIGISFLTFGLIHLAPGDPALLRAGGDAEAAGGGDASVLIERFREEHLLDRPLWVQYFHYVGPFSLADDGHEWFGGDGSRPWGGLLVGDLGRELLRPSVTVAGELRKRLAVTVPLAAISILLSYLIAVPLGIHAAVKRGTPLEGASTALVFALHALPVFWVGVLLQMLFGATGLGWLPVLGLHDADAGDLGAGAYAADTVRHAILPIVCLTYGGLAYLSRQMRIGVVDTIREDYVRTARAKGLSERRLIGVHVLRNSLIPVLTLLGHVLPLMVGGSILVETVFDVPGMGLYAYDALQNREYDAVMGTVLLSALMTLVGFLLSDVLYALVDPRIRHA
jgi:peptide/nickel transport system permease protein